MHALVIDEKAQEDLFALKRKAEENIIPFVEMLKRSMEHEAREHERPRVDPNPEFTVMLKVNYSAVYTIEEHREGVPCRHLSVSGPNTLPHPNAVALIMKLLGFHNPLLNAKVWTEEVGVDRHAINVLEPMDGNWEPLTVPVAGTMQ